jgi:putative hydrolase of the HAD superfamily
MDGDGDALRGLRGILFDYGNTLIRYGRREDGLVIDAFHGHLRRRGLRVDRETFGEVVGRVTAVLIDRATRTGREVKREEKVLGVLTALGWPADPEGVESSLEAIRAAFVDAIEPVPDLVPRLTRLGERFQLGLLSNYFLARPIHDSMRKIGIDTLLEPRVVSAELGWCKPHRKAFEAALAGFDGAPGEVLMVGDNLTADVGGGAAMGMRTAHTTEWKAGALDYGRPGGDGVRPDVTVGSLAELEERLGAA